MKKTQYYIATCLFVAACSSGSPPGNSEDVRNTSQGQLTFEEWKAKTRVREFKDVYAVGDYGISPQGLLGEEEALKYFEKHFGNPSALTVDNGQLQVGGPTDSGTGAYPPGSTLYYCIDKPSFDKIATRYGLPGNPDIYGFVSNAFGAAAAAWNRVNSGGSGTPGVGGLQISYESSRDTSCSDRVNDTITWYVTPNAQPVPAPDGLSYLTFVLGPKYFGGQPQGAAVDGTLDKRYFLLNDYIIQTFFSGAFHFTGDAPWQNIFTYDGLLLHAIGQGIGFIPEQNRGGVAGDDGQEVWPAKCLDTSIGGIFLSGPDPLSVTTHPAAMKPYMGLPDNQPNADVPGSGADCSGFRPFDYAISYTDAMAAACQYRVDPEGDKSLLFYCNGSAQAMIASQQDALCSPVPLVVGGAGYVGSDGVTCGPWGSLGWDLGAYSYGAAVIDSANTALNQ